MLFVKGDNCGLLGDVRQLRWQEVWALDFKDHYGTLGVQREATAGEIKRAYRKLAMISHPDRNRDDPACEERLKEINEAYGVLGDEVRRRQYDLSCGPRYGSPVSYGRDGNDELIRALRGFFRGGFPGRGKGGCRGGFGRGGCRRRSWKR
jgi:curved DNA-binding protein CbpA